MTQNIRVKKAFTLIELFLVIILISTIYFLSFSSFNFESDKKNYKIKIENLKEFLLKNFSFEKELDFTER